MAAAFGGRVEDLASAATQAAFGETERLKAFGVAAQVSGDQLILTPPPCPHCRANEGMRIVIWEVDEPKPEMDCPHCHARPLVFHEVREGLMPRRTWRDTPADDNSEEWA